jgi:Calcineurin-like phosphoesterase superfamily domain
MRLAIFSDLHGNPYACKAVLDAIARAGSFDAILAAGDLCLGGSDPAACVQQLRAAGVQAVYGNTEQYLCSPEQVPPDELHRSMWETIQPAVYWTLNRLSAVEQGWLFGLPFERKFSPTGKPGDDLLAVHANPKDVEMMIYPAEKEQLHLWDELRQPDDAAELRNAMDGVEARMIAFGHFHYMFQRCWEDKTLAGVACCSLPGKGNDQRARFTIFEWAKSRWVIEQNWVEYDVQQEVSALQASDLPDKAQFLSYFD